MNLIHGIYRSDEPGSLADWRMAVKLADKIAALPPLNSADLQVAIADLTEPDSCWQEAPSRVTFGSPGIAISSNFQQLTATCDKPEESYHDD